MMRTTGDGSKRVVERGNQLAAARVRKLDRLGEQVAKRMQQLESLAPPPAVADRTQSFVDGLITNRVRKLDSLSAHGGGSTTSSSSGSPPLLPPARTRGLGGRGSPAFSDSSVASGSPTQIQQSPLLDADASLAALRAISRTGSRVSAQKLGGANKLIYRGGYGDSKRRLPAIFPSYRVDENRTAKQSFFDPVPIDSVIADRQSYCASERRMNHAINEAGSAASERLHIACLDSTSSYEKEAHSARRAVNRAHSDKHKHKPSRQHSIHGNDRDRPAASSAFLYELLNKTIKPTLTLASKSARAMKIDAGGSFDSADELDPSPNDNPNPNAAAADKGQKQGHNVDGATEADDLDLALGLQLVEEEGDDDDEGGVTAIHNPKPQPDELPDDQVDEMTRIMRFVARAKQE